MPPPRPIYIRIPHFTGGSEKKFFILRIFDKMSSGDFVGREIILSRCQFESHADMFFVSIHSKSQSLHYLSDNLRRQYFSCWQKWTLFVTASFKPLHQFQYCQFITQVLNYFFEWNKKSYGVIMPIEFLALNLKMVSVIFPPSHKDFPEGFFQKHEIFLNIIVYVKERWIGSVLKVSSQIYHMATLHLWRA